MSIKKILLFIHTLYFLKVEQVYFRLYYWLRNYFPLYRSFQYKQSMMTYSSFLYLKPSIVSKDIYKYDRFFILNKEYIFKKTINWNYNVYGKLWTYNLTYFDYLSQSDISKFDGLRLIHDFIEQSCSIKDGLMPFPISLRGINWIKFLTKYKIHNKKIDDFLFAQYHILMNNIEYHIMGNHLLENGFSLLYGAYYFEDENFYKKAKNILETELEEQILEDGAHFELSPMYHQIMLFRVLDCINLVKNNSWKEHELLKYLSLKAEIMLGWLSVITYKNGAIPLLNDSANKIAPTTNELNSYAKSLNIKRKNLNLHQSGYRKIENSKYEMIIDIGNIGPDYIPGHAHCDTFNFELYYEGKPFIVDTGLSTYETNQKRLLERSTESHNTVKVNDINQSEVWGGFRVARRAKIIHLKEKNSYIEAIHDGYKHIGVLHKRKFITDNNTIVIEDNLETDKKHQGIAYLHFYPGVLPEVKGNTIIIKEVIINIYNANNIIRDKYAYALEFNKYISAYRVQIIFDTYLKTEIKL